jgi:tetratricopeptide (TPR) repeat protein
MYVRKVIAAFTKSHAIARAASTILNSPTRYRSLSPLPPTQQNAVAGIDQIRQNIVSLICRPEIYRPLPPNMIPQAFLSSANAAKADASVSELVQNGQFYAAAITSARRLANLSADTDLQTVFGLFYTRLACLSIINKMCLEIAAVESLELRDLTAAMYLDPVTNEHVAPWHLRVLAVRLQSIGFKDWRRGVMSYYILAHDARQQIAKARREKNTEHETLWSSRLHDLGIRVANMLVEMGDLEAAGRHLKTLSSDGLPESEKQRIAVMQVMVWLQIGDLRSAKRCLAPMYASVDTVTSPTLEAMTSCSSGDYPARVLHALTQMAEGNFSLAAEEWSSLEKDNENDDMVIQNRAICLLYTGRMHEAHQSLEQAVEKSDSAPFHTLLFNLCTFYELSSDRAREMKTGLTEQVARKAPVGKGWQRATADFKMEAVRA